MNPNSFIDTFIAKALQLTGDYEEHVQAHTLCGCGRHACTYDKRKSDIKQCKRCKKVLCIACYSHSYNTGSSISHFYNHWNAPKHGVNKIWKCKKCKKETGDRR